MSEILAWCVTRDGKPYTTTDNSDRAALYAGTLGFAAIPLVAAPPPNAVEEVRELLRELGGAYAGYETAGRGDAEIINAEVNALESRVLSHVSVAAPPPIGEDEEDLARRLSEAWAGKGEYADHDPDLLRALCGEASVAIRALTPPERAPKYAELVRMLRAWEVDCNERVELWGDDFKALKPEQRSLHEHTSALLSRIPKEG